MAVNVTLGMSRLRLTFNRGMNEDGKEILQTRTFSNVKPDATDEAVYNVAETLGGLQLDPVVSISRLEEKELTEA